MNNKKMSGCYNRGFKENEDSNIGRSFKFPVKVGVKESVVNAPLE
jgi:hypothetical protein